ncbi:MAG: glycosyltransferase family 2 protein, partial [Ilumatobacter sp.]
MEAAEPVTVVGVVVVHEPGAWFAETLQALAAQNYPDLRWLILLASDPDGAARARIDEILPGALVREVDPSSGFAGAANGVLDLVAGDNGLFLLCHDDIAPDPGAVSMLVAEFHRSNAGLVGPKLVDWHDRDRLQSVGSGLDRFGEPYSPIEPGELDQSQHDAVRDVFVLPTACLLVRADLLRSLGGFDRRARLHGEDLDLCWRAHWAGARVIVAPEAVVRHRADIAGRRPEIDHGREHARRRMWSVLT